MICAQCEEQTEASPCAHCGDDPRLDGRYRLEQVVGHGAVGITYRGVELSSGDVVAVKELAYRRVRAHKSLELFHREAEVLRQLDHPAVPRFVEALVAGEGRRRAFFLAQEFIEGRTLEEELFEHRYDEAEALQVLEELLDILAYLHGRSPPIIHRDIKPRNVIRRATTGRLVLVDFGSVRDALEGLERGGSTIAGTFGFMAPEQFRGLAVPATDIFGLGALAVALLSRAEPHTLLDDAGQLVWRARVHVSEPFARLLSGMLEPSLAKRFADVAAVRRAIDRLAEGDETGTEDPDATGALETRLPPVVPKRIGWPLRLVMGTVGSLFASFGIGIAWIAIPAGLMAARPQALLFALPFAAVGLLGADLLVRAYRGEQQGIVGPAIRQLLGRRRPALPPGEDEERPQG